MPTTKEEMMALVLGFVAEDRHQTPLRHRRSMVDMYMKDIERFPRLTAAEEQTAIRRAQLGDRAQLERLVNSHLRFVITVAREYQNQGLTLGELINEGNLGLLRAVLRFDEKNGVKFLTYAVWWIRQGILAALAEQARLVRLPVNQRKKIKDLLDTTVDLEQVFLRRPAPEELAAQLHFDRKRVEQLRQHGQWHTSLDAPLDEENGDTGFDITSDKAAPDSVGEMWQQTRRREIEAALRSLSEREAYILKLWSGFSGEEPLMLEQIGDRLNLTKERVRQIRDKALAKLKASRHRAILAAYWKEE